MSDDMLEQALAAEHDEACLHIARLASATELDRYSRRYNPNDGLGSLHCVLRHPECDAGTALFLYWRFHELLHDPPARACTRDEPARWNADALLTEIEERYPHGFRHRSIAYDPVAEYAQAFGADYVETIRARHAGSALMRPLVIPALDAKACHDRVTALAQADTLDNVHAVRHAALALVSTLPLSPREQDWLAQGEAYAAGRIDDAMLEQVRVEAWDSIDGRDCDFADPQVNRVRAVLCVLYPDDELQDLRIYLETVLDFHAGAMTDAEPAPLVPASLK